MANSDLWKMRYRILNGGINEDQVSKDSETLAKFGASPVSLSPGASIQTPEGGFLTADVAGWNWLMSILESTKPSEVDK